MQMTISSKTSYGAKTLLPLPESKPFRYLPPAKKKIYCNLKVQSWK
jgi:hypothetical protein